MAPEVLAGKRYNCAADVYSFGIILWELLTWQIPWEDLGPWQVMLLAPSCEAFMIAFEAARTVNTPPLCALILLRPDAVDCAQSRINELCCMVTCYWLLYCFPCMCCLTWMHACILQGSNRCHHGSQHLVPPLLFSEAPELCAGGHPGDRPATAAGHSSGSAVSARQMSQMPCPIRGADAAVLGK